MKVKLIRRIKYSAYEQNLIERALGGHLDMQEMIEAEKLLDQLNVETCAAAKYWLPTNDTQQRIFSK